MKRFLFLMLFFIIACNCAFAVPGEWTVHEDGSRTCDTSLQQQNFEKLEKAFYKKHKNGNGLNRQNYNREVMIPHLDYLAELQHKGFCGYDELVKD